jgi:hypothetical protein
VRGLTQSVQALTSLMHWFVVPSIIAILTGVIVAIIVGVVK